jgi:hypothetical protein
MRSERAESKREGKKDTTEMDMEKLKLYGGAAAAAIVIAFGAYSYAAWSTAPEVVRISNVGCGTQAGGGAFGVPLQMVKLAAPALAVSYGPVELPATGSAVRIAFDPSVDGSGREVHLVDDTLRLPTTFGRDVTPERVRITCRDGQIQTVRFERQRQNSTFNVVRQQVS